jgi:ABC-type transporter Mla subunit MlaD
MKEQQATTEAVISKVAASTSESVQRLGEDFGRQGSEAMARVMAQTSTRIDEIVKALDSVAQRSTGSSATMKGDFEKAAESVQRVTQGLGESLNSVSRVIQQVEVALATSTRSVTALAEGATALRTAASVVQSAVARSDESRSRTEKLLVQQTELATQLDESLAAAKDVWPRLIEQIGTATRTSSIGLADSWTRLATQLQQVTARYGTEVGERVEALSNSIDLLIKELRSAPRR